MTIHYMDPSAWVKRHFQETGSEAVKALFSVPVLAACSGLGLVEMLATVARKCSQVQVAVSVVNVIADNIRADSAAFRIIPVDETRLHVASELAMRHRLRAMDAIHLSSALSLEFLGKVVMVSADAELLAAVSLNGLATLNPMTGFTSLNSDQSIPNGAEGKS